jgi:hypothetical protein
LIAILIPVLGRPHLIEPLLENIARETDVEHRVLFICSPGDPATLVCQSTTAETIVTPWQPGRADFAKKINLGFTATSEEWLFQGATDLVFHPQWASRGLRAGVGAGVIGTNDLGNPSVMRGAHATHVLFSREYIDTYGGTFDDSGVVFSEAYDHQFVDNEFVELARIRGQFRPCKVSVVEHLHPSWEKAEMDDTYEKALRETRADMALFSQRMRRMRTVRARRR